MLTANTTIDNQNDNADEIPTEMPMTPDEFKKADTAESSSTKRAVLFNEGYNAGFNSAADDFVTGKVCLEIFEKLRTERDITDFYAIGFEMGYFRKLAEIAVL